jgi:hypothetical protein
MSLKEYVTQEVERLDEKGLEQVAIFLKSRAHLKRHQRVATPDVAALYAQFAQEDAGMAEFGMSDYANALKREDK